MITKALSVSIEYASNQGIKPANEDFVGYLIPEGAQLLHKGITAAIADGMSGSDAGKQASDCCVTSFLSDYYSTPDSWSVKQAGQKILSATNSWLYSQGQIRFGSSKGMVSTLSILVLKSATAHLFHIGDSRIYRLRKGNLEQITRDHRIWISQEKNYLNRAMGIEPRLEVDYKALPLIEGDLFLLTTDGIHDFLTETEIKTTLTATTDLSEMADNLIRLGIRKQSDDNLSCQVVRVDKLPEAKADEILRRHANLPFAPLLKPGMILDGYQIEQELHASKRTQVYKAFDTLNKQSVILKTPSILYDDDTHYIEHFLHEEWAGKRLQHDNVLKVIGTDREKSCIYYVTEYLEGPTLREWMQKHPQADIKTSCDIIAQIAKGLRAFHRMEMLHQDLKPENIMFDKNGTVKIIDFGSVKIAGITEISSPTGSDDENLLGTLNYSAPEYLLGQRGTIKSDLFSLGVILYEMLNTSLPFGPPITETQEANKLAKREYVPSMYCNPLVPIWIDGALKKATSLNPQSRYEEMSEFLHDLHNPNPQFLSHPKPLPLLEKNPLMFWKCFSLLMMIINLIFAYQLAK